MILRAPNDPLRLAIYRFALGKRFAMLLILDEDKTNRAPLQCFLCPVTLAPSKDLPISKRTQP